MAFTGNIIARIGADIKGLQSGLKQAKRDIAGFKTSAQNQLSGLKVTLAAASAALGGALAMLAKNATQSAISFGANLQQINRLLGQNAKDFMQWSNGQANAFGMGRVEAVKYASTYASLLRVSSKDQKALTDSTVELLKMSAVLASSTGRDINDVMERIRSGLLGNTEAIEDLGVNVFVNMIEMTDAFKRFSNGKAWTELDFKTQQQIRLFAILEQATGTYGKELRQNTATSIMMVSAALKDTALNIGLGLKPMLDAMLPTLTNFANYLKNATAAFAEFMGVLFGTQSKEVQMAQSANNAAKSQNKLGKAIDGTNKAIKGSVMGFDEVNTLTEKMAENADATSQGGGTPLGGGTETPTPTGFLSEETKKSIEEFKKTIKEMKQDFVQAWDEMAQGLTKNKDIILPILGALTGGFVAFWAAATGPAILKSIVSAFETLYIWGLYAAEAIAAAFGAISAPAWIVVAAVAALVAGIVYLWNTSETFRNFIKTGLVVAWELLSKTMLWVYDNVLKPIGNLLMAFYEYVLKPIGKVVGEFLVIAWDKLSKIMKSFYDNVLTPLISLLQTMLMPVIDAFTKVMEYLWKEVFEPYAKFMQETFIVAFKAFGETISFIWEKILKPFINFMWDVLFVAFDSFFKMIGESLKTQKEVFNGIITFLTGVFTGDWEKAWNGIKDIFVSIVNGLENIFKAPLNGIIELINKMIDKVNSLSITIPSIPGLVEGKTFGVNLSRIPKLARGGITSGPTLAMVGDNPGGREAIIPLDSSGGFIDSLAGAVGTAVIQAMQFVGSNRQQNGNVQAVFNLDGNAFARAIVPLINSENTRTGTMAIQGV